MHKRIQIILCSLCLTMVWSMNAYAQSPSKETTRILFVYDASQSMYGRWENESKMQIATRLLNNLVDSLKGSDNIQLALRVYGHQDPVLQGSRNCKDTKLEVPFSKDNHDRIIGKLKDIRPNGTTLIAYSLQKAANDFPPCQNCKNVIILITDGIEECDGDPCLASLNLQRQGITLRPFVIGMGIDENMLEQLKCIGNFFDVRNKSEFENVLGIIVSQALHTTSVQVNLLDKHGNPTETNVGMTFYDAHSGQIRYNFVHTLTHRGLPDTLPIDPLGAYRIQVHTVPPVFKDSVKMQAGIHNIIAIDAPQGDLLIKTLGTGSHKDLKAIVRKAGEMQTLMIQPFNLEKKYLTGKYDLEILTLPRLYLPGVEVSQSHTTKVEIPEPGMMTAFFSSSVASALYQEKNNKLELIYRFKENTTRTTLKLQPGDYRIISRPINARSSAYTKEESFTVRSGQSVQVKL